MMKLGVKFISFNKFECTNENLSVG